MPHIHLVEPYELSKDCLFSEYRSIPKVIDMTRDSFLRGVDPATIKPVVYTLGRGHLTFFFNKLGYLNKRYLKIIADMQIRGMHPSLIHDRRKVNNDIPEIWWADWTPSETDIALSRDYLKNHYLNRKAVSYSVD